MIRHLIVDVTLVVAFLTLLGLLTVVGVDRLRSFPAMASEQLRLLLPYLVLLGLVLVVNDFLRNLGPSFSWIVGWRITEDIVALEGGFVATVQGYSHPWLTHYFSVTYIYGYIFLLVFPILAYLLYTDDRRPAREAVIAYSLNYGIGVLCYILFIAYGPRNVPEVHVDGLLYTYWPESQLITRELNANVNVFPSLHASLSFTIAFLAYRWREVYRWWLPISALLALSVSLSTMYLGIHWATDVVAGLVLAAVSLAGAIWLTSPDRHDGPVGAIGRHLRRLVDVPVLAASRRVRALYRSFRTDKSSSVPPETE